MTGIPGQQHIRVLVADDHALMRQAVCQALALYPGFQVLGEATNGLEAVQLAEQLRPDIILMDIHMPQMNGLEATRQIKARHPDIPILVLTASDEDFDVFPALQAGAAGYMLKVVGSEELVEAVRAVVRGESVLHPIVTRKVLSRFVDKPPASQEGKQAQRPEAAEEGRPVAQRGGEETIRQLPFKGTISIIFTDLEESTRLFQTLGDRRAREIIRTHDQLFRSWLSKTDGYEVKHTGDGFMAVFQSARKALNCAIGFQRDLEAFNQHHPTTPLRVRIGVNAGETLEEEEDFFGTAVILAARVMQGARGGQVLVSELFHRLIGTTTSSTYIDLGRHKLHGFKQPQRLYEVDWRAAKEM